MSTKSLLYKLATSCASIATRKSCMRFVHHSVKAISHSSDDKSINASASFQNSLNEEKVEGTPQMEFRGSDFDFPCLNKR